MRVYFFSTCLGGVAYADTCMNAIRLLQKEGLEVVFKKIKHAVGSLVIIRGIMNKAKKSPFIMLIFSKEKSLSLSLQVLALV